MSYILIHPEYKYRMSSMQEPNDLSNSQNPFGICVDLKIVDIRPLVECQRDWRRLGSCLRLLFWLLALACFGVIFAEPLRRPVASTGVFFQHFSQNLPTLLMILTLMF